MSTDNIRWIQIWEVKPESEEIHEALQEKLLEWSYRENPQMKDRLGYFKLNEDGKILRMLVKTGFKDMDDVDSLMKGAHMDDEYMKMVQEVNDCQVPGSYQNRFWVNGIPERLR